MAWLVVLLIATASNVEAPLSGESVQLDLSVAEGVRSLDGPILANLLVRNISDESVYLDMDVSGNSHVNLHVTAPDGEEVYVTADEARTCIDCLRTPPVAHGRLQPSGEAAITLVLDRWYSFKLLGAYEIYVEIQRQALVDIFVARADKVTERDGVPFLQVSEEDMAWLETPVLRSNAVAVHVVRHGD